MRLRSLVVGLASGLTVVGMLTGCGGTSSETPFPQSASEITTDPVLRRPKPGASATSTPPQRIPGGRGSPDR